MNNFDERLQRLLERHEALTESVEHLARQGEEQNGRIDKLFAIVQAHTTQLQQDAENIRGLARIAEIHERRITELEGGQNGEEGR